MTELTKKIKKNFIIPFRLDESSYKFILRESLDEQISISEYIRRIIYNYIKTKK
jgi:hypothetical protein